MRYTYQKSEKIKNKNNQAKMNYEIKKECENYVKGYVHCVFI